MGKVEKPKRRLRFLGSEAKKSKSGGKAGGEEQLKSVGLKRRQKEKGKQDTKEHRKESRGKTVRKTDTGG